MSQSYRDAVPGRTYAAMANFRDHTALQQAGPVRDLLAAFEHQKAGRLGRAEAGYRKVLRKMPDNPDALHMLGVIALDRGRPDQAIKLIHHALAVQPNLAQAHSNLGNAFLATGRTSEAIASYTRAIELDPGLAATHNNLGRALCLRGDFPAAVASCKRAVELQPGLADAHNNLGNALRGCGRLEEAEPAFRRAVGLAPNRPDLHANLGNLLLDLRRFETAADCHRRAIELDPKLVTGHVGLATDLQSLGDVDAALESYRRALSIDPKQTLVWNALGSALRTRGRFEDAIQAFRRAIAIDPDCADPYRNLAICNRLTADEKTVAHLTALVERKDLPVEERVAAGFALGKVLDDSSRFDDAFAAYARANRTYHDLLMAAGCQFDFRDLGREVDETIAHFTPELVARVASLGNPSDLPVFVVGMPRSGTSLVEQIAASHSRVFGAGELIDIDQIDKRFKAGTRAGSHHPWDATETRRLADSYLDRLRQLGDERGAERVIDKNSGQYL